MNLQTTSIPRLLWYYSIPSLIGTVANALYNIVDRIYIGQGVGALAISGMALTFPIMNILGAFGMLVGQGAAAQTSLMLGGKRIDEANKILPNTLYLSIFNYLIISSLCLIYLEPILRIFGGSAATIPYATRYMQIIIPGHILTSLSFGYNNIIRASGRPMLAMYTLIIGALVNVLLDPLFIFVFNLGIQGAAIATVISMGISTLWVMYHFFKSSNEMHFQLGNLRPDFKIIGSILAIGLSPFLLHVSTSLVNILMNHTLLRYGGDLAIGAFGIITSFTTLIVMAIIGLSHGMQPIIGYNYGAKQFSRVRHALHLTIVVASAITTIGSLIGMLFPSLIARCFTTDNTLLELTTNGLRIYTSLFFIVGFHIITTNYFQNIGRANISIFLSLSRQIVFLIPFILLFPPLWQLNGAWLAQPAANFLSSIVAAIILISHLRKQPK